MSLIIVFLREYSFLFLSLSRTRHRSLALLRASICLPPSLSILPPPRLCYLYLSGYLSVELSREGLEPRPRRTCVVKAVMDEINGLHEVQVLVPCRP